MEEDGRQGIVGSIRHAVRLRTRLRQTAQLAAQLASRPSLRSRLRSQAPPVGSGSALVLAVYRSKNMRNVLQLIRETDKPGWETRLWALDEIHPSLAAVSVGAGKGAKFPLLNALLQAGRWSHFEWVVVADDDVRLERGTLELFLRTAEEAGLALAQPAHSPLSYRAHNINLVVPFSIAHLTTFVENGPIFAVHRAWFDRFLPFPDGWAMGWGLELVWMDHIKLGARLGVVDLVMMRHLAPIAAQYAADPERERVQRLLAERGAQTIFELERTLGVWRPWQRRPEWVADTRAG